MKKGTKESKLVLPGVEVFLQDHVHLVRGKRVGLVTNQTGVDSRLESTIELFNNHSDIELTALFGPEHGVTGFAQAGEFIRAGFDSGLGLPVFSLYGQNEKASADQLQNLDETMRQFDTADRGKRLNRGMLKNVEVLMFDLQDAGTRIYTYLATMAHCMEACARCGIKFIVLDRPNPINGLTVEGPLLNFPGFSSFVGMYPVPVRHSLTLGELARLANARYIKPKADLTVIPMKGWQRRMWYDETGLPWILPSPNMPTLMTASVYPGQVFLEGTNVSEGRGTVRPFEFFGAPWIKGKDLSLKLNKLELSGVSFRMTYFKPTFSKYSGQLCQGIQLHVFQREEYRPLETSLHIIKTILEDYPDDFAFHSGYFDAIMGSGRVRKALLSGKSVESIVRKFKPDLKKFENERTPYLLY